MAEKNISNHSRETLSNPEKNPWQILSPYGIGAADLPWK